MNMDKKTDRRARHTQSVIKESFLQLLRKKHIGKITVTEICKMAEINRATFYTHFHDPYDLLEHLETECGDIMMEAINSILSEDRENLHLYDLPALIHKVIESNETLNLLSYTQPSSTNIRQRLFQELSSVIKPKLMKGFDFSEDEAHVVYTFLSSGYYAVDNYFCNNKATPIKTEDAHNVLTRLVNHGLMSFRNN